MGCIIKGETDHNEYISYAVSYGIMKISLELGIPITFGILTVDNLVQALNRAGGKYGNKGEEAAKALIKILKNLWNFHLLWRLMGEVKKLKIF